MHGDEHNTARGVRGMREAIRESADVLKSAAIAHDDHADVELARLYRIQDLQAEIFRLREAQQEAVRQGDENFYRVLDLQDDARARRVELAQWQAYAAGLRGVVGDMLSSDSWRFTWVLRAVSATLRRRKSTGPTLPDPPTPLGIGHGDS